MLLLLESVAMCFILLLICVIGMVNRPAGLAVFYEKERRSLLVPLTLFLPMLILPL